MYNRQNVNAIFRIMLTLDMSPEDKMFLAFKLLAANGLVPRTIGRLNNTLVANSSLNEAEEHFLHGSFGTYNDLVEGYSLVPDRSAYNCIGPRDRGAMIPEWVVSTIMRDDAPHTSYSEVAVSVPYTDE